MKNTIILKCIIPLMLLNVLGFAQTATFSSNFEDQNIENEIGETYWFETGTSGGYDIVVNPNSDNYNSSNYVLKVFTEPGTGGRAEYRVPRMETIEKTYIYSWKRFFPNGMWTDVDWWFCLQNQWKTWPCESGGSGDYEIYDSLICSGAGIFNDLDLYLDNEAEYRSRAYPNCNYDYTYIQEGIWHEFTLEIYWTNTDNGYYRIWRNDTLFGYSDNMKTLFDEFNEDHCNIYWTTGLYTGWAKNGNETKDSIIAYLDDIAVYDIDNGFSVADVCPNCELAPSVPIDSNVYKININLSTGAMDGYNNYITTYRGDTSKVDMSNTFGQNNGIDIYLWSDASATSNNNLSDDCFPEDVITTSLNWNDTISRELLLKDLNPNNTYSIRVVSATTYTGISRGIQIWTQSSNIDTVFAANNTCSFAELKNLVSDENGDLTINVKSIDDVAPRAYINSIEIVESKLPINLLVSDSIIANSESACFNAYNTITVAGNGSNVEIQSGALVNFIAEQSISILPGFHAKEGSNVQANITTDGSFCDALSSPISSPQFAIKNRGAAQALEFIRDKTSEEGQEMKVFPNPNSGEFTIQLLNFSNEIQLSVFNSMGTEVHKFITNKEKCTINLSYLKRGVYFVLASDNEVLLWQKLIIH